jgi:hypothetical protein
VKRLLCNWPTDSPVAYNVDRKGQRRICAICKGKRRRERFH